MNTDDTGGAPCWDTHLQELHRRYFEDCGDRCLLWVNPTQFDVFAEETVAQERLVRISINRPNVNERLLPYLVPLDLAKSRDADLFKASVANAWDAWTLDSLKRFNGQPICGWIATDASAQTVARYWGKNCYVHMDSEGLFLLRFHDPGVRQWLWPLLSQVQKRQMLGPVQSIYAFSRERKLMCHRAVPDRAEVGTEGGNSSSKLELTPDQWTQVRDYGVLHHAWLRFVLNGALHRNRPWKNDWEQVNRPGFEGGSNI